MGWICECGHNKSNHRNEWNPFRGEWNTSCRATEYGMSGSDRCRCNEFTDEEKGQTA